MSVPGLLAFTVILLISELLIDSTTLRFSNVTRNDGGDYECVADNGVPPTDKHSMKLDVKCKKTLSCEDSLFHSWEEILILHFPQKSKPQRRRHTYICNKSG